MAVLHLATLCICIIAAWAQNAKECSKSTLNLCKSNINNIVSGNGNNKNLGLEDQCWRMRHNFDCALWQTSMCLNQDQQEENSDGVLKAWRFMEVFCEKFKIWWTKPCYGSDRLRKCDNLLNSKGRVVDKASCKSYLKFRECAIESIENECSTEDQRLMGVFLMDKGHQKSWNCPNEDSKYSDAPVNAPLAADIRDVMLSDSSSPTCVLNAMKKVQNCMNEFEGVQKMAREILDEDNRKKKICCAAKTYEECILKTMKDNCGDSGHDEAKKLVTSFKSKIQLDCTDDMDCSGSLGLTVTNSALAIAFIVSFFLSNVALQIV